MDNPPEVLIPDVTPEQLASLTEIFRNQGSVVTSTGENAGLAENDCFATKFQYDSGSQLLTLEPIRLVRTLTPRRLRKYVQALIAPPASVDAAAGNPTPSPFSCATYNWTIAFYANNSGGVLTFSLRRPTGSCIFGKCFSHPLLPHAFGAEIQPLIW